MLVSKIKPCMSKYQHSCTVKLQMAHYISYNSHDSERYTDNRGNSRANTRQDPGQPGVHISLKPIRLIDNIFRIALARPSTCHSSFCPISLTVVYSSIVALTGTGNYGSIPERQPEKRLPHLREAAGAKITQF